MPRTDDYFNAAKIAIEALGQESPEEILRRSGLQADANGILVPFLNRTHRIHLPDFAFIDASADPKDVPIQEQVLILHYLQAGGLRFPPATGLPIAKFRAPHFISAPLSSAPSIL